MVELSGSPISSKAITMRKIKGYPQSVIDLVKFHLPKIMDAKIKTSAF
jgi:hypothetical protein